MARQYSLGVVPVAILMVLQNGPGILNSLDSYGPLVGLLLRGIVSAVFTVIVAGLLLQFAEDYTEQSTDRILEKGLWMFLYGLGLSFAVALVMGLFLVLVITAWVGIAISFFSAILFLIWSQLGYLAVGKLVTDDHLKILAVATGLGFLTGAAPVAGIFIWFVLGNMGVGAGFLEYNDRRGFSVGPNWGGGPGRGPDRRW